MIRKKITGVIFALISALSLALAGPATVLKADTLPEAAIADETVNDIHCASLHVAVYGDRVRHVNSITGTDGSDQGFEFEYENAPIPGAQVTIIKNDEDRDIRTAETDADGIAVFEELAPGMYEVRQGKTDAEHLIKEEAISVTISETGEMQEPVCVSIENDYCMTRLCAEGEPNTCYGIFAAEEIKTAEGRTLVPGGYLLQKNNSDEDGKLEIRTRLAPGEYYLSPSEAPGAEDEKTGLRFTVKPGENTDQSLVFTKTQDRNTHFLERVVEAMYLIVSDLRAS